jgi:hypothetical protein
MNFAEKNLKDLKTILLVLKDIKGKNSNDEFGLKSCVNNLQKVYRKDLIFTLLLNKIKIEELGKYGLFDHKFTRSIDYMI